MNTEIPFFVKKKNGFIYTEFLNRVGELYTTRY